MIFEKESPICTSHFVISCQQVLHSAIKQLLLFFLKTGDVILVESLALRKSVKWDGNTPDPHHRIL